MKNAVILLLLSLLGQKECWADVKFVEFNKIDRDSVFPFAKEYPDGISYSFNDNSLYADHGGARMRFIGIERPVPANPGLTLEEDEDPIKINGELGKTDFYTPGLVRSRFPARIFYLFLLDTCEDIREESWTGFQQLITRQLVLD